jgi:hypothetical protein
MLDGGYGGIRVVISDHAELASLEATADGASLAHVPEKWEPVFRTEHAQNRRI